MLGMRRVGWRQAHSRDWGDSARGDVTTMLQHCKTKLKAAGLDGEMDCVYSVAPFALKLLILTLEVACHSEYEWSKLTTCFLVGALAIYLPYLPLQFSCACARGFGSSPPHTVQVFLFPSRVKIGAAPFLPCLALRERIPTTECMLQTKP